MEKAVVEEVHQMMTLMGAKLMAMIMMTGELIITNSMSKMTRSNGLEISARQWVFPFWAGRCTGCPMRR